MAKYESIIYQTNMPSKSKSQQQLFRMVLAVRKGKLKRSDVSKEVLDIVDGDMTDKQIEDFTKISLEGLQDHLKKELN